MHTPKNDFNQLPEQNQEPLIRENLPYDRIAHNPKNIPLINGSNTITLANGETLELSERDLVSQYQDQLLLGKERKFYQKKSGSETFEELVLFEENKQSKNTEINYNTFKKDGIIIAHRRIDPHGEVSYFEYWIDGGYYTMDYNKGAVGFGSSNKLEKKGDQLYLENKHTGSLQIYTLDLKNHSIILNKETQLPLDKNTNPQGSFLNDGTPVIKNTYNNKTTLKVGDKMRKNQLSKPRYKTISNNHPFLANREELVINDESWYKLDQKAINEKYHINKISISPDGKQAGISIQNDYAHMKDKNQLLIIDKNQVHKTLAIGDQDITQIFLYDKDHYAYLAWNNNTGGSFHFNNCSFPLEIEHLEKAEFIDAENFLLSYWNKDKELIHQKISLNPHAEAIQKDQEAREKKEANQAAILTLLTERGIESPEKLAELIQQATKYPQQEKTIQSLEKENQEKEFRIKNLEESKKQEASKNTAKIDELQEQIRDIKEGISARTFGGYNISPEAKKILEI